jgi:hypothetical protein
VGEGGAAGGVEWFLATTDHRGPQRRKHERKSSPVDAPGFFYGLVFRTTRRAYLIARIGDASSTEAADQCRG